MDFSAADFLAEHGGDALKALDAIKAKWDAEGKAAALARRQRDEAKGERDAAKDLVKDLEKRATPEGATVLTGDDATAWQTFKERGGLKAFDDAEQVKAERDRLKRETDLGKAALALGKPQDALAEILEGKTLSTRTVKGEDGKDAEEWIVGEGETAKPLASLRSAQLLGTAEPAPKPAPAPLPTGQRGGAGAPKTVEQRTAEVRREISI